jgi:F0F1-type ATP synthase membrane subunit b/b'
MTPDQLKVRIEHIKAEYMQLHQESNAKASELLQTAQQAQRVFDDYCVSANADLARKSGQIEALEALLKELEDA